MKSAKPWHLRALNIVSVLAFLLAAIMVLLRLPVAIAAFDFSPFIVWVIVGSALFAGYVGADFASGFVHFLGDTIGSETTPILGEAFIKPFREHHTDQKGITRHDFFETNGHNCLVSLPFLAALVFVITDNLLAYPVVSWLYLAFFSLVMSVFATNQIHKWAHQDKPNTIATWLQKKGIVLSPEHHKVHHTAPHDTYYCITLGVLNPVLEKMKFFPTISRSLAALRMVKKPSI